ncbi:MAG: DUF3365 domain-containing protein [Isosphaeraceae bacterium]
MLRRCLLWPLTITPVALTLALVPPPRTARAADPAADAALERTRAQAKMLDDLFKVAVVDITNRYDGPPAAKVAKTIFAAARQKQYFDAKLLDITGSPQNEANVPKDAFEKRAANAIGEGKAYFEEVVESGDSRRLRVATAVPAVTKKCASCHGVKEGDPLGFLSYDLPVK